MSRSTLIITTVVVLAASAAIIGWSFFGLGKGGSSVIPTPGQTKQIGEVTLAQQAGCVPPVVDSSTLSFFNKNGNVYGLIGKLKEIRETSKTKELITDIKGQNIPKFFVIPQAEYFFSDGGKDTRATASDLKVDQKVVLSIYCSATSKNWFVARVRIVTSGANSSQPTSSPSAR